jgi:RNA polymerase sigma-70 factor (ECF subfamily)
MKTRDPEAFRALYREHHPTIRRYFAARAPASQVDDLAAETFLVAWRRFADMPPPQLPWLLNVAAKVHANQRRKAERVEALVERLTRVSRLDDPDASVAAERRAQQLAVLRALAQVGPGDRELMLLSLWDGLRASEIALVLDVNPVATRARLSRARRRLERALRAELDAAGELVPRPLIQRTTA